MPYAYTAFAAAAILAFLGGLLPLGRWRDIAAARYGVAALSGLAASAVLSPIWAVLAGTFAGLVWLRCLSLPPERRRGLLAIPPFAGVIVGIVVLAQTWNAMDQVIIHHRANADAVAGRIAARDPQAGSILLKAYLPCESEQRRDSDWAQRFQPSAQQLVNSRAVCRAATIVIADKQDIDHSRMEAVIDQYDAALEDPAVDRESIALLAAIFPVAQTQ